jgi:flavin reductase (DIM6/NTAB) family NADH-FMN oxidoreductase RutF
MSPAQETAAAWNAFRAAMARFAVGVTVVITQNAKRISRHRFPAGNHVILLGEVMDAQVREGAPMVYFNRSSHRLSRRVG